MLRSQKKRIIEVKVERYQKKGKTKLFKAKNDSGAELQTDKEERQIERQEDRCHRQKDKEDR